VLFRDNLVTALTGTLVSRYDPLSDRRLVTFVACWLLLLPALADEPHVDPAEWGTDHVGETFPDYITGDECLFCHRPIGTSWPVNPHQRTTRQATSSDTAIKLLGESNDNLATEPQFLIGSRRITRYLRRAKAYGKLEMLSAAYLPANDDGSESEKLIRDESMHWDADAFADRCAGCHATAVDAESRSFSTLSLDCVTCHGEVELEHTGDANEALLSTKIQDPRKVISICGQCHLRGGRSKSSGLSYPNTFVPGDNLFRDFEIDFSSDAIGNLPLIEQHIYLNARDVVATGIAEISCVTCHEVHQVSSEQHQSLSSNAAICTSCHRPGTDNSELSESFMLESGLRTNNRTCDY